MGAGIGRLRRLTLVCSTRPAEKVDVGGARAGPTRGGVDSILNVGNLVLGRLLVRDTLDGMGAVHRFKPFTLYIWLATATMGPTQT